ncbi:hypothetical protein ABC855_g2883 [[Candida] zeylanoides]
MADSESSEGSGTGSDYESSSDEDVVRKPVFIGKRKSQIEDDAPASRAREIALQKLNHQLELAENDVEDYGDYDGVDDADDVDVDGEYRAWLSREDARRREERAKIRAMEEERNERIHLDREDAAGRGEGDAWADGATGAADAAGGKLGAFFASSDDMKKLAKRAVSPVEDSGDHSRPTKFKKR